MTGPTSLRTTDQHAPTPRRVAGAPAHDRPAAGIVRGVSPRLAVRACGHTGTGSTRVAEVIAQVRYLHDALAARPDLAPGPVTNDLFSRLVALAITPCPGRDAEAVLDDPAVEGLLPHLRRMCAEGEFELERSWAERVVGRPDPLAEIARFPYAANYRDLTRLEHHAVAGLTPHALRRILFIGSGPLPLTSLLWAERYGCAVDNLDVAPEAVRLGTELAGALGATGLRFTEGDAADADDLDGYDLVYLAALAGLEPDDKHELLAHLGRRLRPGTLVLARSAHSLRALLYPVLDPDDLPGLDTLAVVHPYTDVVNSVVVARVPG